MVYGALAQLYFKKLCFYLVKKAFAFRLATYIWSEFCLYFLNLLLVHFFAVLYAIPKCMRSAKDA